MNEHYDEIHRDKMHRDVLDQFPFKSQLMGGHLIKNDQMTILI